MKCDEIRKWLSAYADDELTTEQQKLVEQHLKECADCRNRLTEYKAVSQRLGILQAEPSLSNFTRSVMLKIKEPSKKRYAWSVKRSLFVAVPLVIVLAVVGSLFVMKPFVTPEKVMAKAYAATEATKSYRITHSNSVRISGMTTWMNEYSMDIEYASETEYHIKLYSSEGYHPHSEAELIVLGDKIYKQESTSPTTTFTALSSMMQFLLNETINGHLPLYLPSKEATLNELDSLVSVKKLPSEKIDGVKCLHYRANLDMEKYLAESKVKIPQIYGLDPDDPSTHKILQDYEDFWRPQQIIMELWIGEDDYLVRQSITVIQPAPDSNLISSRISRSVSHLFDFNQQIVIQPPLDITGQLLPGWSITER